MLSLGLVGEIYRRFNRPSRQPMTCSKRASANISPDRRSRSNKKRESGARRARDLGRARAPQHRKILSHMRLAADDPARRANAVATVILLSSYYAFTPLEWDGLASEEKLGFYQLAGDKAGCNVAVSFNVSDRDRQLWVSKYGDITKGVSEIIIRALRDAFRNTTEGMPPLWFVVEAQRAKGRAAKEYVDGEMPRRFGFHGAVRISKPEQLELFESVLRRFAYNEYAVELRPIGGYMASSIGKILLERRFLKKRANRRRTFDPHDPKYTPAGWFNYTTKALKRSTTKHVDVCGLKPYGATKDLHSGAKALYDAVRIEVIGSLATLPSEVLSRLDALIGRLPALNEVGNAETADRAIEYALFVARAVPASAELPGDPLAASARSLAKALAEITKKPPAGV